MADMLLVVIRDSEVTQAIADLGFKLLPSSGTTPHFALQCIRAVPDWGGAFLALTPDPNSLPQVARDRGVSGDILVPMQAVLIAAHVAQTRSIGFQPTNP